MGWVGLDRVTQNGHMDNSVDAGSMVSGHSPSRPPQSSLVIETYFFETMTKTLKTASQDVSRDRDSSLINHNPAEG